MTGPIVNIPGLGKVQGALDSKTGTVARFLNVPFGTVTKRWWPASPPVPWEGIRDASLQGPMCPQKHQPSILNTLTKLPSLDSAGNPLTFSERDCLNLNIYAPASLFTEEAQQRQMTDEGEEEDDVSIFGKVPVAVWVHGGGLMFGGNGEAFYDATALVQRSIALEDPIIVVVLNYRLGFLGFITSHEIQSDLSQTGCFTLSFEQQKSHGNFGLHDQRLGFEFVRSQIQHFGGNPKDVTGFGESAGAISLNYHALISQHGHLFDKLILQSGATLTMPAVRPEKAQFWFNYLCKKFKVGEPALTLETTRSTTCLEALRNIPVEDLVDDSVIQTFMPNVDGFLIKTDLRREAWDPSIYNPTIIRTLIGTTKDEGTLFGQSMGAPTVEKWEKMIDNLVPRPLRPKFDHYYGVPKTDQEALKASWSLIGEGVFQYPVHVTVTTLRKGAKDSIAYEHSSALKSIHWPHRVTEYQFDRDLDLVREKSGLGTMLGAHHVVEVPFVFGASNYLSTQEQEFSEKVQEIWIRFITGQKGISFLLPLGEKIENDDCCSIEMLQDFHIGWTTEKRIFDDRLLMWGKISQWIAEEYDRGHFHVGWRGPI